MAIVDADIEFETLADFLHHIGVSPDRVLYRPRHYPATESDVIAELESPRKRICELIDGYLVEKAMGLRESVIGGAIVERLRLFVRQHRLGFVTGEAGTMRLWAGRVRIPDVAFVSWDQVPDRRIPDEPVPELFPDIAIEVLSRSNTRAEMALKREDYFASGCRLVWELDPETRTAAVYTDPVTFTTMTESDELVGDPVLPGFRLPLRNVFAELDAVP